MFQPGLMMDRPLLISGILEHAAAQFADVEIVSRETHGPLHRTTYGATAVRARQLANALKHLGLGPGSAVGSIAWNNHRHLEAYYAVSGSGMVMHTCNPRLHPQQLVYIINHAEDRVVVFDSTFAPLIKGIAAHCPRVKHWVALTDAANMPGVLAATEGVAHVECYEDLIAPHSAFLLLQGVETLAQRMTEHVANARAVADWLEADPRVAWVSYSGLPGHRNHDRAVKYTPRGPGAVFSFVINGGFAAAESFINNVQLLSHLANIGDSRTLVIHPASTTHQQLNDEQLIAAGVPADLVRLSVGLEDIDDILWDIDQALTIATGVTR